MAPLRTHNVFMLKSIVDDNNVEGGLMMVASLVQTVWDLTEKQQKADFHFKYRFNECTPGEIETRATQHVELKEKKDGVEKVVLGVRTTFHAKIPLDMDADCSHNLFPFKIHTATSVIELSSEFDNDTKQKIRPDLLLHKKDRRSTISIQNMRSKDFVKGVEIKLPFQRKKTPHEIENELVVEKIDKTKKYDFVSPYPKVYYQYDVDKKYCPRFVLTFHLLSDGFHNLVQIVLPLLLVTFLAALNVWHDWESGSTTDSHLQVSSALTLAIVVVLPSILDNGNRTYLWSRSNLVVMLYFLGMVLASCPSELVGKTVLPEFIGLLMMGVTLLFLMYNTLTFIILQKEGRHEALKLTHRKAFLKDETFTQEMKKFKSFGDYLEW